LAEGSWLSDWNRFVDAWTWADGELLEPVRRKFRELSPEERVLAIEHIPAYGAETRRRRSKPMSARTWVSRKGWEPFVLAAKKHPTMKPGSDAFVFRGTQQWIAWAASKGLKPEAMFAFQSPQNGGKWGAYFPTLWPPRGRGGG
jgi:hypothetical protein